jgi:hypothetical protein
MHLLSDLMSNGYLWEHPGFLKMPKPLVTRIPDISMTKMSIDDFLSGLSPMAPIAAARLPLMDGPDYSSHFQDF